MDTIRDIVPTLEWDSLIFGCGTFGQNCHGWRQDCTWWEGDRFCTKFDTDTLVGEDDLPVYLDFIVRDYAAEGDLYIYSCQDTSLKAEPFPIKIPHDYDVRFKNNADPDSDGFTNWEEYRGFVVNNAHIRLDSTKKDFFLKEDYPNRQQIQTMLNNTGTRDWIVHEENPSGEIYEGFTWLDVKPFKYSDSSSHLIPNQLCFPGVFPDTFVAPEYFNGQWHQGIIPKWFLLNTSLVWDTLGVCGGWNTWRGCGNVGGIIVFQASIAAKIDTLVRHGIMPSSMRNQFRDEYVNRDWVHELGHGLGLDDVSGGTWDCVMRQAGEWDGLPSDSNSSGWSTFHFYSPNLYYGGTPGLRP